MYVRIQRGPYRGDIAQVRNANADANGAKVEIKIAPRIKWQAVRHVLVALSLSSSQTNAVECARTNGRTTADSLLQSRRGAREGLSNCLCLCLRARSLSRRSQLSVQGVPVQVTGSSAGGRLYKAENNFFDEDGYLIKTVSVKTLDWLNVSDASTTTTHRR